VGFLPSTWWLIAAAALMTLEAFGIPGIGFVFAGLSALLVAGVTLAGIFAEEQYVAQFSLWFALTAVLAALLWKPMKRWRVNPEASEQFSNMIGAAAVVCGGALRRGHTGSAKWSGTTMRAELSDDAAVEELAEGETALIQEVRGTVLILKPRSD
jgi:membrane protein implicated in regulation of membrane protease activity